ncbi:glycine oxidase ThiO [Candidatus Woesearchaeota archaeon]|nr:glycine oxidase ThiO [Candidatus Woesearchaeota archaeon]
MNKVIIIGGGAIGMLTAYRLANSGQKVVLIDKGKLGQEASSAAAGMLRPQSEAENDTFFFRLCLQSKKLFALLEKELYQKTGVGIEYTTTGTLLVSDSYEEKARLHNLVSWQKKLSLPSNELDYYKIQRLESSLNALFHYGVLFPDDHFLCTPYYVEALVKAVKDTHIITIYEHISVSELILNDGKVLGVVIDGEQIFGDYVVIAAGAWSNYFINKYFIPDQKIVYPVKGHCLAVQLPKQVITHSINYGHLYLVPGTDNSVIIGSTMEDVGFDRSIDDGALQELYKKACFVLPVLKQGKIVFSWIGFRPGTKDGLPILGTTQLPGCLFATGHFRNGILLSPITAKIITDLIVDNKEHPLLKEFSLGRFMV